MLAVFCVKYFQPAWQHQAFWSARFLKDFPEHASKIITAADTFLPWTEIRRVYRKLHLLRPLDFEGVDLSKLHITNVAPIDAGGGPLVGVISYGQRQISIHTPVCEFPFGVPTVDTPWPMRLRAHLIGSPRMDAFYQFLRRFQQTVVEKTAQHSKTWLGRPCSVQECRELCRPIVRGGKHSDAKLDVSLPRDQAGKIRAKLFGPEGQEMQWPDFPRHRARGSMIISCTGYVVLSNRNAFGVRWNLERLYLEGIPETPLLVCYSFE